MDTKTIPPVKERKTLTDHMRANTKFIIDPIVEHLARYRFSPDALTVIGMLSHFLFAWLIAQGHTTWAAVAIFITPVILILFVQWGEAPDRVVAVSHLIAVSVFTLFALGMEVSHFLGYQPEGAILYRILAHLGWTFAWAGIYRKAKMVRAAGDPANGRAAG